MGHDVFVGGEKFGEVNTEATGNMVVANASCSQLPPLSRQGSVSGSGIESNGHDAIQHLYHFR